MFPPTVQECSLFSTPSPAFIVCRLFDDGHSDWCEVISYCSFDLSFSNGRRAAIHGVAKSRTQLSDWTELNWIVSDAEHLFMWLLAICMSSWRNVCLGLFPIFWLACFSGIELSELLVYFGIKLILCQLFHLLFFLPFWGFSFHLAYSFLCCAKAFEFNQVLLVYFCFYFHSSRRWVIEDLALIYVIECSVCVFLSDFYSFWSYI